MPPIRISIMANFRRYMRPLPIIMPPPLPPKPWLDDAHRSIDTHYFSEPGPLGLKVRVGGSDAHRWQVQASS